MNILIYSKVGAFAEIIRNFYNVKQFYFHFCEHFISFKSLLKLSSRQKDGGYHSTDGKKCSSWDLRFLFGGGQGLQVGLRWHHGPQKSSGDCEREGHGAEEL